MRLLSHLVRPAISSFALSASRTSTTSSSRLYLSQQSAQPAKTFTIHESFEEIVDKYDAFILDQFGVLHNGANALEGAIECVEYLAYKMKKKLIILSNTSAPADKALLKLPKFGFPADCFVDVVTSGEEASRYIRKTYGANSDKPTKAVFITWDASIPDNPRLTALPQQFLDQCGNVEIASCIEEADFLLIHGSEVWCRGGPSSSPDQSTSSLGSFIETGNLDVVDTILQDCLKQDLPLICANPDIIVQTPSGGTAYMPGRIAERYKELGGKNCVVFGKPHVEHFEACIEKLGLTDKSRVAHVGDSLTHDIGGANAANIPNVFVTSGIHSKELGVEFGELPALDVLERLLEEEGSILPTHVVSTFRL